MSTFSYDEKPPAALQFLSKLRPISPNHGGPDRLTIQRHSLDSMTESKSASRRRVVTKKPTRNGCRTCRYTLIHGHDLQPTKLMHMQNQKGQMRRGEAGLSEMHVNRPDMRRL